MKKILLIILIFNFSFLICLSQVSNYSFYCSRGNPYNLISGNPGPTGDDQTITVQIPFTFNFSGTNYSQASICSNGWIGLGATTFTGSTPDVCTSNTLYSV